MNFKALKSLTLLSCASLSLIGLGGLQGRAAHAQISALQAICETSMTEITTLPEPAFGMAPTNWLYLVAGEGDAGRRMDVFSDIIPLPEGHLLAVGAFAKDEEDTLRHPLMVRYDERLRKVWETRVQGTHNQDITRVLRAEEDYVVLGSIESGAGDRGFYLGLRRDLTPDATEDATEEGSLSTATDPEADAEKSEESKKTEAQEPPSVQPQSVASDDVIVVERGAILDAKAIAFAPDGTGFIVAATWQNINDPRDRHGLLYKFSPSGREIWKRAYKPGMTTLFQNLQATLDGDFVISGQILSSAQKASGFLMRVDPNGAIRWQQTYPRGQAAVIHSAAPRADGGFILTGRVRPLPGDGGGMAAMIVRTDGNGAVLWQRYLRGEAYDYAALDAIVYEDGRASVLLNGTPRTEYGRAHARLITFSERGEIHYREDFTDGQNAYGARLVSGLEGDRLIAGYAQTSFGEDEDAPAPPYTYDGWIMSAVSLAPFDDPCAKPETPDPILP